ncbi:FUN14 family-domain-containing protein [Fimicolochytrium jonesii]|uniref:FUN14 family-domain-containing protein n=1 Tax=Fimicolochytrium jonesii TaxID=1396493 RepID=UPI0022FF0B24|nr:FUN14 family-domain-containing protein [Fimicolochytrium jonesii]KAI8817734.1 FUN14 family-domain-containing protein [Fimicolochytrium jonesii]
MNVAGRCIGLVRPAGVPACGSVFSRGFLSSSPHSAARSVPRTFVTPSNAFYNSNDFTTVSQPGKTVSSLGRSAGSGQGAAGWRQQWTRSYRSAFPRGQSEGGFRKSLTAIVGSAALCAGAVWLSPDAKAGAKTSTPLPNPHTDEIPELEVIPPPPPGWFREHVRPEVLTVGGALGACTGLLTKKLGKVVAFGVGAIFVLLQWLNHSGFITISWSAITSSVNKKLHANERGELPPGAVSTLFRRLLKWLTADVPFTGAFCAGFWVGFRYG